MRSGHFKKFSSWEKSEWVTRPVGILERNAFTSLRKLWFRKIHVFFKQPWMFIKCMVGAGASVIYRVLWQDTHFLKLWFLGIHVFFTTMSLWIFPSLVPKDALEWSNQVGRMPWWLGANRFEKKAWEKMATMGMLATRFRHFIKVGVLWRHFHVRKGIGILQRCLLP